MTHGKEPSAAKDEAATISMVVNGDRWSGTIAVTQTLIELLRSGLALTGTKRSCEVGVCGACTVLVDGMPVSSCTFLAVNAHGRKVTTIEGLARRDGEPDSLQAAFVRHSAFQCGYCTSGMLLSARALLDHNADPTLADVVEWLDGNTCRCGAYSAILRAVMEAAAEERARD